MKISIDELIDMADSRYSLVTIISKRARQLVAGQLPRIRTATIKPVSVAIEEFYSGEFHGVYDENIDYNEILQKCGKDIISEEEFQA